MTDSVVVEGQVRLRDGKKWKSRWVVFRKPSPVADCLLMLVFKDKSERVKGHKERCSMTLEDICGLDPGLAYEGMSQALAIVCLSQSVILGFDNKDIMHAWDVRLRYSLGEVYRFHVGVLPGTKLECGPATLHICNDILVLARDTPPIVIGQWKLTDLRRYGAVPNGFVFEGGTRCGYWAGVFFLSCAEGDQISFLFDCIVRGISPTKGPFGLRPVLPDPNLNPAYMEERVAHEALEIEKRLSILSYSSRQSSGGDDRSLSSSSSDTSHSDVSIGSRLTLWAEPSGSASTSLEGPGPSAAKGLQHLGEEKGYTEALRPAKQLPKPGRPARQLQEIGRQSSSDSGIATGSHSSYSGSFSSYTGSLDTCQGEEFGSLLSLPPDQSACTCQQGEYLVPSTSTSSSRQQHQHYDTPRSLLHPAARDMHQATKDHSHGHTGSASAKRLAAHTETKAAKDSGTHQESTRDTIDETYVDFIPRWPTLKHQGQLPEPKNSEIAPPGATAADPCEVCSLQLPGIARAPLFAACPVCGGLKGTVAAQPGATPAGAAGHSTEQPSDRHHCEYVNIPVSPTSKKQLHYMELELQEPTLGIRGGGSTKYAQIDIAATETAHKVGSQHAQFREDRLQELEQKKKGSQQ